MGGNDSNANASGTSDSLKKLIDYLFGRTNETLDARFPQKNVFCFNRDLVTLVSDVCQELGYDNQQLHSLYVKSFQILNSRKHPNESYGDISAQLLDAGLASLRKQDATNDSTRSDSQTVEERVVSTDAKPAPVDLVEPDSVKPTERVPFKPVADYVTVREFYEAWKLTGQPLRVGKCITFLHVAFDRTGLASVEPQAQMNVADFDPEKLRRVACDVFWNAVDLGAEPFNTVLNVDAADALFRNLCFACPNASICCQISSGRHRMPTKPLQFASLPVLDQKRLWTQTNLNAQPFARREFSACPTLSDAMKHVAELSPAPVVLLRFKTLDGGFRILSLEDAHAEMPDFAPSKWSDVSKEKIVHDNVVGYECPVPVELMIARFGKRTESDRFVQDLLRAYA